MLTSEIVALLDLLASRGTVAWQVAGPTDVGARLVIDTSGVDSAMRLLISRGFAATRQQLPSLVELAHPRYGRVLLLPCSFGADGDATWHGPTAPQILPAEAFDAITVRPPRVRVTGLPGEVAGAS